MFHLSKINAAYRALWTNDHNSGLTKRIMHCTENLIYRKFTQSKFSAKRCKLLNQEQRWYSLPMLGWYFLPIYEFTSPCKLVRRCGVYHLCLRFPPTLNFFAPYFSGVNLCKSNFSCSDESTLCLPVFRRKTAWE